MLKPNQIQNESEARLFAQSCLKDAVCMLALATNACDERSHNYRYRANEQERLKRVILELFDIVDRGHIDILPIAKARGDAAFQNMLDKLI